MTRHVTPAVTVRRMRPHLGLVLNAARSRAHIEAPGQTDLAIVCPTRLRSRHRWDEEPVPVCGSCLDRVVPVEGNALSRWEPTPEELAAVYLHETWATLRAAAELVEDLRSQAMADGSALVVAETLPEYRAARQLPDDSAALLPHQGGHLLGAVLGHAAPQPVATVADDQAAAVAEQARRLSAERMNVASRGRRDDLRAAREATRARRAR